MRLVDWYLGLDLGQKIVVGIAVPVLLFVFTYLASILILSVAGVGQEEDYPAQQGGTSAPASLGAGASASASPFPDVALNIKGARWEGDEAVVEGTWQGELSSVHCDLLKGGGAGSAIDWWDRSVAAKENFSDKTFSQEFVRAEGGVEDRIEPEGDYWATCWAQFSEGTATGDEAPVEGKPPAG